jgi:hypothetical protein
MIDPFLLDSHLLEKFQIEAGVLLVVAEVYKRIKSMSQTFCSKSTFILMQFFHLKIHISMEISKEEYTEPTSLSPARSFWLIF